MKNLSLTRLVRITKEVHKILREQKKNQKISMAEIVCNLILEKYGKDL